MPNLFSSQCIYLVRHFAVQIQPGICYGQSDIPGVPISTEDLTRLKSQLPSDSAVFSSPLQRCASLAQLLFPTTPIALTPLLMELNFGAWELTPWDLIARTELDNWAAAPLLFTPPQGESFADLCQRVQQFVRHFPDVGGPLVIFTHAGVIKAFLYLYAGQALDMVISHSAPLGSVTRLQLQKNNLR